MNMEFLEHLDDYLKAKRYRLVNSVLVYENDELVFERYYNKFNENSRHQIKSIWKSILSLTLGVCLDKNIINDLDEPICRFLAPFNERIDPYHELITIRHLLTMSSGIYWNDGAHHHFPLMEQMRRSKDWIAYIADVKMTDIPGEKFVYKEWDVILLSMLIQKICGGSVWDICNKNIYEPLEISSDRWTIEKCGVEHPGSDFDTSSNLSARDLAKIGLLMFHDGKWNGRQIVSEEYIKMSLTPSAASNRYGYFWWLSNKRFYGQGFGGQELNIYPEQNIVAVIQAAVTSSSKFYFDICENIIE